MYKLEFSKNFILDQTVALEYIALMLFNPNAAKKLKSKIDDKIDKIIVFRKGFLYLIRKGRLNIFIER